MNCELRGEEQGRVKRVDIAHNSRQEGKLSCCYRTGNEVLEVVGVNCVVCGHGGYG